MTTNTLDHLKRLNHDWIAAFNRRDWSAETAIRTPDFTAVLSGAPGPLNAEAWNGFMQAFTTAFPDSKITIDECIAEGNLVATRWSLTGTHQAEFQGIPATGRSIQFHGLEFNRVEGDQFAEHWSMFDNVSLLRQLGVLN